MTSHNPPNKTLCFNVLLGFRVRCEITVNSQQYMDYLDIVVNPYWAPRAASRFLELVREKYYDGAAFNRVVPKFLTQFGIAKDFTVRTKERELTIWDDFPKDIKFEPGMISFAGSGHDSRTTEIFIVNPGVSQTQLDAFGENSWETPFAKIDGDVNKSALKKIYSGYGDMPPFGNGKKEVFAMETLLIVGRPACISFFCNFSNRLIYFLSQVLILVKYMTKMDTPNTFQSNSPNLIILIGAM